MPPSNRRPWRFTGLAALILLTGGIAVGMAARLVVSPQANQVMEVDTPTPPSFVSQSVDEVVFYPWNQYDPEHFTSDLFQIDDYSINWCISSLVHSADLLELTVQEGWDIEDALVNSDVFYWKDRPATTKNGQPVMLDVGGGKSTQDFGLSMVARSTGELPTRAQKEAALDQVQQDVCALFDPQGGQGDLYDTLQRLWTHLDTYQVDNHNFATWEGYGLDVAGMVYPPIEDLAFNTQTEAGQTFQQRLDALSQAAQSIGYHIQLVTTQRQVVVVLTQTFPDTGNWFTVGVYYDAGLGQYSGVVLNSHVN